MAVKIDIEFNQNLQKEIEKAFAFLEKRQFRRLMSRLGGIVKSSTQERLGSEGPAPDGSAWPDNNRDNNVLLDTGALRSSIKFAVDNDYEVEIGTDLIYGATHQFGDPSRNIKQREYLGISRDDERDILEEIDSFLKKELGD